MSKVNRGIFHAVVGLMGPIVRRQIVTPTTKQAVPTCVDFVRKSNTKSTIFKGITYLLYKDRFKRDCYSKSREKATTENATLFKLQRK